MEAHKLIFITGGARSGKSTFAEHCATTHGKECGTNLVYVATSRGEDAEMEQRIANHRQQRTDSGYDWQTVECPMNLTSVTDWTGANDVVLLDCLTVLLTNELFSPGTKEDDWMQPEYQQTIMEKVLRGIDQIQSQAQRLIVVSNDVLHEPIQRNVLVHTYCKMLGMLHQMIVQRADEAYLVEAGIPIAMKGGLSP